EGDDEGLQIDRCFCDPGVVFHREMARRIERTEEQNLCDGNDEQRDDEKQQRVDRPSSKKRRLAQRRPHRGGAGRAHSRPLWRRINPSAAPQPRRTGLPRSSSECAWWLRCFAESTVPPGSATK